MVLAIITTRWADGVAAAEKPLPRATLWVARSAKDEIVKVNSAGKVLARIDAGRGPNSVAVGAGAVWFTTSEGSVLRVDPTTNRVAATIPVGTRAGAITTGDDTVWVAEPDAREVVRIDPVSNAVVARISVGTEESCPTWLTADATSLWAVLYTLGIARIDATTNTVAAQTSSSQAKSCQPASVALAGGRVWILDTFTGRLLALDPKSLATISTSQLGTGVWQIAGDANSLWALNQTRGRLVHIDPRDGSIMKRVSTNTRQAQQLVLGADSVWFYDGKAIVRVSETSGKTRARIKMSKANAFTVAG
jgi:streptogramin lyase